MILVSWSSFDPLLDCSDHSEFDRRGKCLANKFDQCTQPVKVLPNTLTRSL